MPETPPATERLRFRPYRLEDADDVREMFADDQARRFYPAMDRSGAAERWIQDNLDRYVDQGFGLWALEHRTTGSFVGDCGLTTQRVDDEHVVEIGYHVTATQRGRGYATEAARVCLEHAAGLGIPMVCSIVDPDNVPSIRVATRIHGERRLATYHGRRMILFWADLRR